MKNNIIRVLLLGLILISNIGFAQMDVANEPHHINLFKNDKIQILNGDLKKGDTSFFHKHSRPSLVFVFTDSHTNGQDQNKEWKENSRKAGTLVFKPFDTPQIHRTTNLNIENYQMHDVEILKTPNETNLQPLKAFEASIELKNKHLFAYRKTLENASVSFQARKITLVTIIKGERIRSTVNNKTSKYYTKKDFFVLKPGDKIKLGKSINAEIIITEFL